MTKKEKIIITGYSGFVGTNLVEALKNDFEVFKLSLRQPIADGINFNEFNAIIHLAGKAHDLKNISNPNEYLEINRDLTINLFNLFLKSSISDFFYFSSVKAVKDSYEDIITETTEPNPKTAYGISKLEAEKYMMSYNLPKNKRLFIIRPCMIHGPGNKGNLNLLYQIVKKGLPWPLGKFENQRSFISIDNLSYLMKSLLNKKDVMGGIYNFADDECISTNELVEIISLVLQRPVRIWGLPKTLILSISRLGDYIPFPINSERLSKLTESYIVSNEKVKQSLKISSLPYSAKFGLIKTIKSFNS